AAPPSASVAAPGAPGDGSAPGASAEPVARATAPGDVAAGPSHPPAGRLPEGVAPVAYDLTLELDPDQASFAGRVAITIAAAPGTTRLWLHAVDLQIARMVLRA